MKFIFCLGNLRKTSRLFLIKSKLIEVNHNEVVPLVMMMAVDVVTWVMMLEQHVKF